MPKVHKEMHLIGRIGWLRAAVLGANDGILSTASLIVGVSSASGGKSAVLIAGLAGLVAGAAYTSQEQQSLTGHRLSVVPVNVSGKGKR